MAAPLPGKGKANSPFRADPHVVPGLGSEGCELLRPELVVFVKHSAGHLVVHARLDSAVQNLSDGYITRKTKNPVHIKLPAFYNSFT